jgi:hypothetical protein
VPIRDARTLRTLALLDLETHPPSAAIDRVVVAVDPTSERVVQFSLISRPLPSPEQVSTLMARLTALMGEGRCGSPAEVDSWQPGAFVMRRFGDRDPGLGTRDPVNSRPSAGSSNPESRIPNPASPTVALRRFRSPIPIRVRMEQEKPQRVDTDRRGLSGGRVATCAGPWRTSGGWWTADKASGAGEAGRAGGVTGSLERRRSPYQPPPHSPYPPFWDRDEWDVVLCDGTAYRLFRDRRSHTWFLDGIVD